MGWCRRKNRTYTQLICSGSTDSPRIHILHILYVYRGIRKHLSARNRVMVKHIFCYLSHNFITHDWRSVFEALHFAFVPVTFANVSFAAEYCAIEYANVSPRYLAGVVFSMVLIESTKYYIVFYLQVELHPWNYRGSSRLLACFY